MTDKEIVQALRQCAQSDCSSCGMCPIFPDRECVEHLAAAAASLIERLTAENAELRKEIEWKDMVISLAQREQAKALDAADLIDCLTAENAALREKKRWISVTEKTPEYDMPQLALNADGDALIANYAYGEWFDTWGKDVDVTHWMPLPEAPEEGGKA